MVGCYGGRKGGGGGVVAILLDASLFQAFRK